MTADTLKTYSCKLLAEMAKKRGVQGWHAMKKDQLVKALLRMTRSKLPASKAPASKSLASKSPALKSRSSKSSAAKPPAAKASAKSSSAPARSTMANTRSMSLPPAAKAVGVPKAVAMPKAVLAPKAVATRLAMRSQFNGKPPVAKPEVVKAAPPKAIAVKPAVALPLSGKGALPLGGKVALPLSGKGASPLGGKPVEAKVIKPPVVVVKPVVIKESAVAKRLQRIKAKVDQSRDLSLATARAKGDALGKDRLVVMVRDPFWLHAYWELSRQGVERAEAALAQEWHACKPILRLLQVSSSGTTTAAESLVRDIEIHGGVNNWYIDVQDPPKSYRLEIGYRGPSGRFFVLARSNVVSTPKAGVKDALDEHWTEVAENYDKIYAQSGGYSHDGSAAELQELFEERLRRPMGSPMVTRYGTGAEGLMPRKKEFFFEVDAELIVYGVTEPNAHVTLQGDPVRLRPDGTFTVRFTMPNCRQVIPAVASSANGVEQRTIVLAVERNTKTMEPLIREANE